MGRYLRLSSIPGITLVRDWIQVRREFHDVIKLGGKGGLAMWQTSPVGIFFGDRHQFLSDFSVFDLFHKSRVMTVHLSSCVTGHDPLNCGAD